MTVYFVSRHEGAINWIQTQKIHIDVWVAHLDIANIKANDLVIGTLPLPLAYEVCLRKATYLHLCLSVPEERRGQEYCENELQSFNAHLRHFIIQSPIPPIEEATL